jgi:hypothetical protein
MRLLQVHLWLSVCLREVYGSKAGVSQSTRKATIPVNIRLDLKGSTTLHNDTQHNDVLYNDTLY